MEHTAALIANLSHSSATMSIVRLAVSSGIRSAKRRASLARRCQCCGSLKCAAMGMEQSQEASLEEEAALLPGRWPQVVIMSAPHKRQQHGMLLGNRSVDLNQKSRGRLRDSLVSSGQNASWTQPIPDRQRYECSSHQADD